MALLEKVSVSPTEQGRADEGQELLLSALKVLSEGSKHLGL